MITFDNIGFVKLHPYAKMPQKTGIETDACYDVWCTDLVYIHKFVLEYSLGFTLNLPKDVKVLMHPRSSIRNTGLVLCNSTGIIDEEYRGEYKACFYHVIPELIPYKIGDKIAQIEIESRNNIVFEEQDFIDLTARATLGFGSTGQK